jgi:hypothetical protein
MVNSNTMFEYVQTVAILKDIDKPVYTIQNGYREIVPIIVEENNELKIYTSNDFDFIDDCFYIHGKFRTSHIVSAKIIVSMVNGKEFNIKFSQWKRIIEAKNLNKLCDAKLVKPENGSEFVQLIESVQKDRNKHKGTFTSDDVEKIVAVALKRNIKTIEEIKNLIQLYKRN